MNIPQDEETTEETVLWQGFYGVPKLTDIIEDGVSNPYGTVLDQGYGDGDPQETELNDEYSDGITNEEAGSMKMILPIRKTSMIQKNWKTLDGKVMRKIRQIHKRGIRKIPKTEKIAPAIPPTGKKKADRSAPKTEQICGLSYFFRKTAYNSRDRQRESNGIMKKNRTYHKKKTVIVFAVFCADAPGAYGKDVLSYGGPVRLLFQESPGTPWKEKETLKLPEAGSWTATERSWQIIKRSVPSL